MSSHPRTEIVKISVSIILRKCLKMVSAFQVLQPIFCTQGNIKECNKFVSRGIVCKALMSVSLNNSVIRNVKFFVIPFISFCFVTHGRMLVTHGRMLFTHIKSIRYLRLQRALNMTVVFGVQKIRRGK
jgi:hypothetical protein